MSAIAYITDDKMLENHRLYQNTSMNFWRISTRTTFSDFGIGGIVFFLSKDKRHKNVNKEKGIVGFGRLSEIYVGSPELMWKNFRNANGYNTSDDFYDAIKKASKDHLLPEKMSSLFLENVCFFASPIYLSEFGIDLSKNVESYVYIKKEEIIIKLLEYGKKYIDIWSSGLDQEDNINKEEIGVCLSLAHKRTGDIKLADKKIESIQKETKEYIRKNPEFRRVLGSYGNIFSVNGNNLEIIFYHNKDIDIRMVIGQAILYRKYVSDYYPNPLNITLKTYDNDPEFSEVVS